MAKWIPRLRILFDFGFEVDITWQKSTRFVQTYPLFLLVNFSINEILEKQFKHMMLAYSKLAVWIWSQTTNGQHPGKITLVIGLLIGQYDLTIEILFRCKTSKISSFVASISGTSNTRFFINLDHWSVYIFKTT